MLRCLPRFGRPRFGLGGGSGSGFLRRSSATISKYLARIRLRVFFPMTLRLPAGRLSSLVRSNLASGRRAIISEAHSSPGLFVKEDQLPDQMRVAQEVEEVLELIVAFEVVVDRASAELSEYPEVLHALGPPLFVDVMAGQPRRRGDVQPVEFSEKPESGLVEMGGGDLRDGLFEKPVEGDVVLLAQIEHQNPDARAILRRGAHPFGERRARRLSAVRANPTTKTCKTPEWLRGF